MRTKVKVQNIKFCGCKLNIIDNLSALKNIYDVVVNQDEETVSFEYNTHHDFEKAKHVLSSIGYPVTGLEFN
ncbi:cation transporter [Yeosuana sp.]|uniref:cation transporter n=1 Tax=Yeosuana sp. TaxID=2529388 RepID=UPI004054FEE3|tara:strand:- start:190 stop:405 length:216 start_codon:yes stop_codon:yes gene_type:complete